MPIMKSEVRATVKVGKEAKRKEPPKARTKAAMRIGFWAGIPPG
jgi:hypothetical protein